MKLFLLIITFCISSLVSIGQDFKFKNIPIGKSIEETTKKFRENNGTLKCITGFGYHIFSTVYVKDTVDVFVHENICNEFYVYSKQFQSWPALKKKFYEYMHALERQYGRPLSFSEEDNENKHYVKYLKQMGGKNLTAKWSIRTAVIDDDLLTDDTLDIIIKVTDAGQIEIIFESYNSKPDNPSDI